MKVSVTPESIERLAETLLTKHRVYTPPVNIDEIANAEGLDFQMVDLDRISGGYVRDGGGRGHAMISAKEHRLRRRFTKGHELAHHLIDEPEQLLALGFAHLRLPAGYRGRDRHWAHERFAAALLMPRGWIAAFVRDRGWRLQRETLVSEIGSLFDVSKPAAEIRLVERGHLVRRTAVARDMRLLSVVLLGAIALSACGDLQGTAGSPRLGFVDATIHPSLTPIPSITPNSTPAPVDPPTPTPVPTPVLPTRPPTVAAAQEPAPPPTPAPPPPAPTPISAAALASRPAIGGLYVSARSVVRGGSFTFSAHLTSQAGISQAVVMFTGADGTSQSAYQYLKLTSGTANDGTWTATIPVPPLAEPGMWTLRGFGMGDAAGHWDGTYPEAYAASCRVTIQ